MPYVSLVCHLEMLLLKCNCASVVLLVPHSMHMAGMQHIAGADMAAFTITSQAGMRYLCKGALLQQVICIPTLIRYLVQLLGLILCIFTLETVQRKEQECRILNTLSRRGTFDVISSLPFSPLY